MKVWLLTPVKNKQPRMCWSWAPSFSGAPPVSQRRTCKYTNAKQWTDMKGSIANMRHFSSWMVGLMLSVASLYWFTLYIYNNWKCVANCLENWKWVCWMHHDVSNDLQYMIWPSSSCAVFWQSAMRLLEVASRKHLWSYSFHKRTHKKTLCT